MPLGVIFIPALGGYFLLRFLNYTRFGIARDSGYHVLLKSAIAGGVVFALAHGAILAIDGNFPEITSQWESYIDYQFSSTVVLGVLLEIIIVIAGNLIYSKDKAAEDIAIRDGDLIELLIRESMQTSRLVELSLRSGKSYIGFALESGIAKDGESDISIIPMASGYRSIDTQELEIMTNYAPVIEDSELDYTDFQVVIPKSEIVSVRLFDPETYQRFQRRPRWGRRRPQR